MPKFKDLTGQQIGRWTVISRGPNQYDNRGYTIVTWLCRCKCGTERIVRANGLLKGRSTSCGCYHKERLGDICSELFTTHRETKTRLYQIWASMLQRCSDSNSVGYQRYGERGISVCKEWHRYEPFRDWALANGYREDLTIDRVDNDKGYCPENCRWATVVEQCNNRSTNVYYEYEGEKHSIAEWARILDMRYKYLYHLLRRRHLSFEQVIQNYT